MNKEKIFEQLFKKQLLLDTPTPGCGKYITYTLKFHVYVHKNFQKMLINHLTLTNYVN